MAPSRDAAVVLAAACMVAAAGCGDGGKQEGPAPPAPTVQRLRVTADTPLAGLQWRCASTLQLAALLAQARLALGTQARVEFRPASDADGTASVDWIIWAVQSPGSADWPLDERPAGASVPCPEPLALRCADTWGNPIATCKLRWVME